MKIAFDISDLCTGRADGTTHYTRELAYAFPTIGRTHDWQYCGPCSQNQCHIDGAIGKNVTWHASPWPKYWTQLRFPFDLYRIKPDVLFMPIQQIPYLIPRTIKTVAVIHDLAIHKFPEQFPRKDWALLHIFSAYVARRADHIIAVSQATANDLAYYYGRTHNVHVVHHGVNHQQFFVPPDDQYKKAHDTLIQHYPVLQQPHILFVGQIQPRKNIVRLVEAFEQIKKQIPEMQLVIVGSHGWKQQPILTRIKQSSRAKDIHLLGRVSDMDLTALYRQAQVYVLPSLYEGFGMPILEAMASGCPVVTSTTSSMPEVAGDAAVLIDPLSSESIGQGILTALHNKEALKQAGIQRASGFTWEKTAQQTMAVLEASIR